MKKLMMILLAGTFVIPVLNSCKKGEDDPAISFKSRDARICQTWALTKIEGTKVSNGITSTFSYDGNSFSEIRSDNTSKTGTGSYEMTLDKHGSISYVESYLPTGGTLENETGAGKWFWVDSDKDKSFIYIYDAGSYLFFSNIYYCKRLSSKELVLNTYGNNSQNGDLYSNDRTYTFERKK